MKEITLIDALASAQLFIDGDWVESKDQDMNGDVRLIQLADIGDGFFIDKSKRFLTLQAAKRLKCTFLESGDVLIARMPDPLGRACIFPGDVKHAVTVVDVCIIRVDPDQMDASWLVHCINSHQVRSQISEFVTGTTRQRISRGNLSKIKITLPSLVEQKRIAVILDKADSLRKKRREALGLLNRLTQSIFIEMFGEYQHDSIRWPIETFEQLTLDTQIGLVRGSEDFGTDFDVPYVRMNALGRHGEFFPQLVQRTNVTPEELENFSLKSGDLLFNTRNSKELVGKSALFREHGEYVYNNNLMRIRFKSHVEPEYIAAAFLTPFLQQELETRKSGTTSVFAIYGRELKTLPIPIPPLPLQKTFASRIKLVESLKARHVHALAGLDALFASLQFRAFSAQL